jgi:uncharacterized protein
MENEVSRRSFLLRGATAGAVMALQLSGRSLFSMSLASSSLPEACTKVADKVPWKVEPFPMTQVHLRDVLFKNAMEINRRYLHLLPNDRLLHTFRLTAGLPSSAEPIGGWEAPDCELRGHYAGGHYLSACALTYSSTGDGELKDKANALVGELARCQKKLGTGYLGAYPSNFYDRLRDTQKVWAPFYTYHKIMAGHLDMYLHCGNAEALDTAEKMARWAGDFVNPLSDEHMARVLRVEHGGMMEALFNLYAVTGKEEYLQLGRRFDHKAIFDPLQAHRDELNGKHANTNIPKIIGAARGYELTGEKRYFDIADYFWTEITSQRAYCTGGTSGEGEGWHEAGKISTQLAPAAQECCCSYNMMKLTRHLYGLTADPAKIDYYERLLYNVRLGTQDPDGMVMYFVSTAPGLYRTFSTPYDSFLCCGGTGIEEFSKTQDTIYFRDAHGIYVNLFIASEVDWPEKGIKLVQHTRFPEEQHTTLTVSTNEPVDLALHIRIPYWAEKGTAIQVNGEVAKIAAPPGSYAKIERRWANGDKVDIHLPMHLHIEPTPDDPTVQAMMFGPMVLAGNMGNAGLEDSMIYGPQGPEELKEGEKPARPPRIKATGKNPTAWVEPVPGKAQEFRTVGQIETRSLIPFYKIFKDRYTLYWKVES